jgi:hypothetical protein
MLHFLPEAPEKLRVFQAQLSRYLLFLSSFFFDGGNTLLLYKAQSLVQKYQHHRLTGITSLPESREGSANLTPNSRLPRSDTKQNKATRNLLQ